MLSVRQFAVILDLKPCKLGIQTTKEDEIFEISFLPPETTEQAPNSTFAEQVVNEIHAYLSNPQYQFKLPLAKRGSDFQRRAWQAMTNIPAGQVETYGSLARSIASNARAVGQACGSNPYPLVIPCHRVVSQQGIGGFAHAKGGWLIATKRWLLEHENAKGVLQDFLL